MVEATKEKGAGFRIKWADKEVEYFGDGAKETFDRVFDLLKNLPTNGDQSTEMKEAIVKEKVTQNNQTINDQVYDRLLKDAKVPKEQFTGIISLEKRDGVEGLVPILPAHPSPVDAVRLIVYTIQVGLQKTPVEISYLKDILKKANGYPLAGDELGEVLKNLRRQDATITSQTQGRNMPITLSTKGLEQARLLINKNNK